MHNSSPIPRFAEASRQILKSCKNSQKLQNRSLDRGASRRPRPSHARSHPGFAEKSVFPTSQAPRSRIRFILVRIPYFRASAPLPGCVETSLKRHRGHPAGRAGDPANRADRPCARRTCRTSKASSRRSAGRNLCKIGRVSRRRPRLPGEERPSPASRRHVSSTAALRKRGFRLRPQNKPAPKREEQIRRSPDPASAGSARPVPPIPRDSRFCPADPSSASRSSRPRRAAPGSAAPPSRPNS